MTDVTEEQQLQEYESQLKDVEELLQLTPDDTSLLSLRSDLLELIKITRQSLENNNNQSAVATVNDESHSIEVQHRKTATDEVAEGVHKNASDALEGSLASALQQHRENEAAESSETLPPPNALASGEEINPPPKKKAKTAASQFPTEFEVPTHLVPLDTDTEAEKNRKRRAIKALKSKWREQKKTVEATQKQNAWQSFQNKAQKAKKIKEKSIFSTTEDGAVGVVSVQGRHVTDFGERKRFK